MTDNDSSKKKLSSSAKAFVPQSALKASASAWTPGSGGSKTAAEVVAAPAPATATKESKKPSTSKPTEKTPVVAAAAAPAPKAPVMAWGKKASNAIKAAPTPEQAQVQAAAVQARNNQRSSQSRDRDRDRNGNNNNGGGQWRKQNRGDNNNKENNKNWRHEQKKNHNQRKQDGENDGGGSGGWQRGKLIPLDLLKPGEEGDNVKRIHVNELLVLRLSFVAPPLKWDAKKNIGPPAECRWESDTRVQEIDAQANKQRLGGDVSSHRRKKKENETAPPLEECKPLEVNEQTRWKANVFKNDEAAAAADESTSTDSDDAVLKKSLMILNKLSLTKFEKLSDAFIDTGIGRNEQCLTGAIELVVKKAQDEPHFAAMYAALCQKLSRTPMSFEEPGKKKKFKKILLTVCQSEFDLNTDEKIAKATEGIEDEEDIQLKKDLVKKHYLGHMRFIGELYKGDLISIKIMLLVLSGLIEQDDGIDEEKVECFTKLITVIGDILEQQCNSSRNKGKFETSDTLEKCWDKVRLLAGRTKGAGPEISNRIKFMLQDLLEMKENGWTSRREVESAKTIAQIHKEAAKEARRGSTSGVRRSTSTNSLRRSSAKPTTDADGFTEVVGPSGGINRSLSMGNFPRNNSRSNLNKNSPKRSSLKSSGSSFAALNGNSESSRIVEEPATNTTSSKKDKEVQYLEPSECGKKTKNYLKEFFVSGDADDAVLSIHELIGVGADDSVDRGTKVVEGGTLMVLEMKADDVDKFLLILTRCFTEKKIEASSILAGLYDPLEFLSDIAIDAPLASTHMATIVAAFVKIGAIQFDFLLNAPEYFRTDGGAAGFGCKVLKKIGDDSLQDEGNIEVIEKLMTDDDKAQYPTAKDLLAA